ncbi:hypothetical protein ACHAXS_011392 [Conticribra weissflogii]
MPTAPTKIQCSKSSKRSDKIILSPSALDFDRSCRIVNESTDSSSPGDVPPSEHIYEFKIVVVGDGGVGKSALVKRLTTDTFEPIYECTRGADTSTISFPTNRGILKFHTWDTAGVEKFGGLKDGYYIGSKAAIIMFDLESRATYTNAARWYKDVIRVCPGIPFVLLGNKADSKDRKVKSNQMSLRRKLKCNYYEISVKKFTDLTQPFLHLARILMNDTGLNFIEKATAPSLRLFPGAVQTDDKDSNDMSLLHGCSNQSVEDSEKPGRSISKRRNELLVAAAIPLPDDSGDEDDVLE